MIMFKKYIFIFICIHRSMNGRSMVDRVRDSRESHGFPMCEKVTGPCINRSLAIVPVEMAKLVSNLITLVLSSEFLLALNAGGGDKYEKNESDTKTEVHLDLAVC